VEQVFSHVHFFVYIGLSLLRHEQCQYLFSVVNLLYSDSKPFQKPIGHIDRTHVILISTAL